MGRFRDILFEDLLIKAFSLVFAIFLWMSIVGGESAEEFFVVPLTIKDVPENMIISSDVVDYVNVRVRGQRGALNTLNVKQIKVNLDLKDVREGENTVTLFPEEIKLPEGVTAIRVSPSIFTIEMSSLTEKWLPVVPTFLGVPASGYKIGKVTAIPPKVAVMGLQDALQYQTQIETRHIELFGRDKSFSVNVDLKPFNANVYIQGKQKVNVNIEIIEKRRTREFQGLPVRGIGSSAGIAYHPDHVDLTVSGPETAIAGLLPTSILIEIPEQSQAGTFKVKPRVTLPSGVELVSIKPETVEVKVKKVKKTK